MPSQVSDPHEAFDILTNLELRIVRLRLTARAHDRLGRQTEATKAHAEADKLQDLLDLLRTVAGCPTARSA
jgi:hypothetical protein